MASLIDLLLYKKEIEIINPITNKPIKKVWVRVLGDFELNKAYKASRVASAIKRAALRDTESDEYKDEVLGVVDLNYEEQIDLVKTSRTSNLITEAQSVVVRPNLPELPEITSNPDAPTLENLEELDKQESSDEEKYKKNIQEYIDVKLLEIDAELRSLPQDKLIEVAKYEVSNVLPFATFIEELNTYKAFYGTFQDKACKLPEFEDINEYRNLPKAIKDKIIEAISSLELSGEEVKN
jgi:hypothetical protein